MSGRCFCVSLLLGPLQRKSWLQLPGRWRASRCCSRRPSTQPRSAWVPGFSGGWRSPPRGRGRVAFWGFRWGKLVRKSLAGAGGYSEEPCQALGAAQRLCFSRSHTYIQQARVWEVDLPGLPQVLSDRTRAIISPRFLMEKIPHQVPQAMFFQATEKPGTQVPSRTRKAA